MPESGISSLKIYQQVRTKANQVLKGDGLRARAARGGAWLGSGSFAEQVSRFARNMLLTRLLAPSAFGAMAIVLSASSLISTLSDVGVLPAVIQNPRGGDDKYLNAAWWLGIMRAICNYAMIFIAAPWIAQFYGNADLSGLLRVAFISTVLEGMLSPRAKLAHKQMKFGRWAIISNGGGICGVLLTVGLSFVLRDVWALAIGYCSENAFRCILSYILFPGLPSLRWDKLALRELLTFSRGMVGLSFLNLIFARTDIFVLGKLYPSAVLGIYTMAVYLVQTPTSFLINMLSSTIFPAFSHVQEDSERVNRILTEVTSWIVILGLPAVAVIWLCGSSLLTIAYGTRYATAAAALTLAAAVMFLNTLNSLITSLFYAAGKPALHRRAVAASAVTMLIVIYPACKYLGVVGGQLAALLAIAVSYFLQVARARDVTGLNILFYCKPFVPGTLVAGGILVVGMGARLLGFATKPFANIGVTLAICLVGYMLSVPVFARIRKIA